MVLRKCTTTDPELRFLQLMQAEGIKHHARWRSIWFLSHTRSYACATYPCRDAHKELQRILPTLDQNQNLLQPPAAGLRTQHQYVFFIPPPRVVGGAKGTSAPVSTATLGLINRHDLSLAAQLREDPGSLASRSTRLRVYSTMRLIRTGMLGQLASSPTMGRSDASSG